MTALLLSLLLWQEPFPAARYKAAKALVGEGRFDEAIAEFQSMGIDRGDDRITYQLAWTHLRARYLDKAHEEATNMLYTTRYPHFRAKCQHILGAVANRRGQYQEALAHLRLAIDGFKVERFRHNPAYQASMRQDLYLSYVEQALVYCFLDEAEKAHQSLASAYHLREDAGGSEFYYYAASWTLTISDENYLGAHFHGKKALELSKDSQTADESKLKLALTTMILEGSKSTRSILESINPQSDLAQARYDLVEVFIRRCEGVKNLVDPVSQELYDSDPTLQIFANLTNSLPCPN